MKWFMGMIDAHAHLHDKKYDGDREKVIARFFEEGGEAIITVGTSISESRDAVALAQEHEKIYATVGLHPHVFNGGAKQDSEWEINLGVEVPAVVRRERLEDAIYDLEELIDGSTKVVAIGEVGLDYFAHDGARISDMQRAWQAEAFRAQIALAQRHSLPVVVHCRPEVVEKSDAYFESVEIIKQYPDVSFVMHCYMGNQAVTKKLLERENVVFSFTGNVTYSKSDDDEMSNVIKMIPLSRMLIETDAPYLTPVPHRGKRNEPLYVHLVAMHIARCKKTAIPEIINHTTQNTKNVFHL